MFFQKLNYILALKLERNLFSFSQFLVVIPSPPSLNNSRNLKGVNPIMLLITISIHPGKSFCQLFQVFSIIFYFIEGKFFDSVDYNLFLLFNDVTHSWVIDCWMNIALHHSTSFIIFDKSFPSLCGHSTIFTKSLLSKITQS